MASSLASVSSRKDKASKAFSALSSHLALVSSCLSEWQQLQSHLSDLQLSLQHQLSELSDREKDFDRKTLDSRAALAKREESIPSREQASLARVQEQKDAAIATILEERAKLQPGRAKKDVDVPVTKAESPAVVSNKASNGPTTLAGAVNQAKIAASEVKVRPQLKSACEKMDAKGLRKFIVDQRKDAEALRGELPSALQAASDACSLVLKASEDLDPSQPKDITATAARRACILLLECLAQVIADPVLGVDYPIVSSNIKDASKAIAKRWRSKLDVTNDEHTLDAHAFLQLVATFGIASEFKDDDLCTVVTAIARRRQVPALCRTLGLAPKIPGLVDKLSKAGKQIEALSFAHEFGIMERVKPVPMLNSYLSDACKAAQTLAKNAPTKAAGQNDATMKELSALRAVMKAVEEYNLGSQYPTGNLHQRVAQLEKEKEERKRASSAFKQQGKKPRLGGAGLGAGGKADRGAGHESSPTAKGVGSVSDIDRGIYINTDLGRYGGSTLSSYGLSTQVGPEGIYGSAYGAANRSPVSLSSSYRYPSTDAIGSSLLGSASAYSGLRGAYSSYQFGSGLRPPSYSYPSYLK